MLFSSLHHFSEFVRARACVPRMRTTSLLVSKVSSAVDAILPGHSPGMRSVLSNAPLIRAGWAVRSGRVTLFLEYSTCIHDETPRSISFRSNERYSFTCAGFLFFFFFFFFSSFLFLCLPESAARINSAANCRAADCGASRPLLLPSPIANLSLWQLSDTSHARARALFDSQADEKR